MSDYTIYTKSNGSIAANADLTTNDANVVGQTKQFEFWLQSSSDLSTLLQYGEWGGKYSTNRMIDGTLKYVERIPSSASIDSIVLGIEPSTSLQSADINGAWGLIDNVSDIREAPLGTNRINISLTVLAEYTDYADHTAIETALQI